MTVSFALMFLMPALGVHGQLMLIAISAVGFDLGLQSSLVAHQNLVYSLEPQARGRLNALLFTVVFIGMALGSALGSKYLLAGWLDGCGRTGHRLWRHCAGHPSDRKRACRLSNGRSRIKKMPNPDGLGSKTCPVSRHVLRGQDVICSAGTETCPAYR